MPLGFPLSAMLRKLWGRPPGLRGTPSSRIRNNGVSVLQGASRPTGASAAVQGDRPTIYAGAQHRKNEWHWLDKLPHNRTTLRAPHPLDQFHRQRIQTVGDAVGFHVDQLIALGVGSARLHEGAMILAQVGEVAGLHGDAAQVCGQEVQGGIDIVGESGEFRACGDGLAAEEAGFQRHRGVDETVRVGQDGLQRGEPAGGHAGFEPQARDGGFECGARQAAGLARTTLEASVARLRLEPGVAASRLTPLQPILANSHRFIHAAMALEAGLFRSQPVPARPEFATFANNVDSTLYFLAAYLRGVPVEPGDLPDLREDHRALVQSGASHAERYELVNVESDRVTNSLNTLSVELIQWVGSA